MKIKEAIYSQGTAEEVEDGMIINPPFFGVIDGASAAYRTKAERILFNGMTGGEMVRKLVLETFYSAGADSFLEETILQANQRIGETQEKQGISLDRTDLLAQASFVFIKIEEETVTIIQGGDCFALWLSADGGIGITENQAFLHDTKVLDKIALLMRKYKGDRQKMWMEFAPFLAAARLRDVNKKIKAGFAQLTGQPWLPEYWKKIIIPKPRLLLLFSDGLVPFEETAHSSASILAKKTLETYQKGGLGLLLQKIRKKQFEKQKLNHIDQQEITVLALSKKQLLYQ